MELSSPTRNFPLLIKEPVRAAAAPATDSILLMILAVLVAVNSDEFNCLALLLLLDPAVVGLIKNPADTDTTDPRVEYFRALDNRFRSTCLISKSREERENKCI